MTEKGRVYLDKPLSMKNILDPAGFTFQTNFEDVNASSDSDDEGSYCPKLSSKMSQMNIDDEDTYDVNQGPFSDIQSLMVNVDKDGFVKKRIFREGMGDVIPPNTKVNFNYNGYLEFEPQPYDSTYRRRKPKICRLGMGELIVGLDWAVGSMKINEKAQFILEPNVAYGEIGCAPLIAPKSAILFEVELHNFVLVTEEDEGVEEDRADFPTNFQHAVKLCDEGNYLIKTEKKYKVAIRNYNEALNKIGAVVVQTEDESDKYIKLITRLYTNLAVSHLHLDHYKKCCINCQEVYKLCKVYVLEVPTKIYYSHAKALFGLNEFERAEEKLRLAADARYHNPDQSVIKLYNKIQAEKANAKKVEQKMSKAMLKLSDPKVGEDFKKQIKTVCNDLLEDKNTNKVSLPDKLSDEELAFIRKAVTKFEFKLVQEMVDGKDKHFIIKA